MDAALPIRQAILFGSHARGDAWPDSDIDLCLISAGADHQFEAARRWRRATRDIWPIPAFTLIPISPARLEEKKARDDHFFHTVLTEGLSIATQD